MSAGSRPWQRLRAELSHVDPTEILQKVNAKVNRARYVSDSRNWRESDYWSTPQELLTRGGDCEDYAIAKYLLLREIGVEASRMHVAVGMGHAFLVVMTDTAGAVVLDNQYRHLRPLSPSDLESIVFTMNELGWSVNVGRGEPRQRFAAAFAGNRPQP
jgi:predicted transglutaminase-like cysteine proteinase